MEMQGDSKLGDKQSRLLDILASDARPSEAQSPARLAVPEGLQLRAKYSSPILKRSNKPAPEAAPPAQLIPL